MEASLVRKARRIPHSLDLVFSAPPIALDEPPPPLEESDPANTDFIAMLDWIGTNIEFVQMQEESRDPDLNGKRRSIIRRFHETQSRLEGLRRNAWEKAKIRRGIYSDFDGVQGGPQVLSTGTRLFAEIDPNFMHIHRAVVHAQTRTGTVHYGGSLGCYRPPYPGIRLPSQLRISSDSPPSRHLWRVHVRRFPDKLSRYEIAIRRTAGYSQHYSHRHAHRDKQPRSGTGVYAVRMLSRLFRAISTESQLPERSLPTPLHPQARPWGRCVQHLTGTNGWEAGSLETYQIVSLPKPVFLGSRIVLPRGFRGYTG